MAHYESDESIAVENAERGWLHAVREAVGALEGLSAAEFTVGDILFIGSMRTAVPRGRDYERVLRLCEENGVDTTHMQMMNESLAQARARL